MDALASTATSVSSHAQLPDASGPLAAIVAIGALVAWLVEKGRKGNAGQLGPNSIFLGAPLSLLRSCAPELAGLAFFGSLAAWRLARGGHDGFEEIPEDQSELWAEIQSSWPVLSTADSLFVLQAMLRFVLLVSVAIRGANVAPLTGSPAAFALLAQACRLLLFKLSPLDVYHIDGPLGGLTSVVLEMAALPPLLILSRCLSGRGLVAVASMGAIAVGVANSNAFAMGGAQPFLDTLFSLVQLLDACAAAAFLRNAAAEIATADGKGADEDAASMEASAITYVLLPLQALLPSIFFLTAFAPPLVVEHSLVRAGRPFEMMWAAGAAQVVFYSLASVLRLVRALDGGVATDDCRNVDAPLLQVDV